MSSNTYDALKTVTVASATSSVTLDNIPSNYTDLVLVVNAGAVTNNVPGLQMRFNSDSSSLYSGNRLQGNGTTTNTTRNTSGTQIECGNFDAGFASFANGGITFVCNIQNYSSTSIHKTVVAQYNAYIEVAAMTGMYRSTSAINSITMIAVSDNFAIGSTFSVYGIRAEGVVPSTKATGGVIYSDDTHYYHAFAASGTFTPTQSLTADVLVVAGGGGGGGSGSSGTDGSGGGGAGGLLGFASQSLTATGYTVSVGSGGAGVTNSSSRGATGNDSQFGSLTLVKGGGGGGSDLTSTGLNGGSGGGAGFNGTGGSPTSGQGNAGGTTSNSTPGGGGGAGAAGSAGVTSSDGGNGGNGLSTFSSYGLATGTGQNISGTVWYAGGGGGASDSSAGNAGTGGNGGGGLGMYRGASPAASGLVHTGGGGGGAGAGNKTSGNGGSGVVIVRYLKA